MKYYFIGYRFGNYGYGNIEVSCEIGIKSFDDLEEIRDQIQDSFSKIKDRIIITNFKELKFKSKGFKIKWVMDFLIQ